MTRHPASAPVSGRHQAQKDSPEPCSHCPGLVAQPSGLLSSSLQKTGLQGCFQESSGISGVSVAPQPPSCPHVPLELVSRMKVPPASLHLSLFIPCCHQHHRSPELRLLQASGPS